MKNKLNLIIKFLCFTILFFILSRANIYGEIFPFAFPMLFALAWANQKVYLLAPAYIIGHLINYHAFPDIINALVTVLFLLVPYYIHLVLKKPMKKYELFIFSLFSQVSYITFGILNGISMVAIIGTVLGGLAFLYGCLVIFEPLIIRGFSYKLTAVEMTCGAVILMAISAGLVSFDIYGFSLLKLFVSFGLLVLAHVSTSTLTLIFSGVMGLGSMLPSNNPIFVAPFLIWSLAVLIFRGQNKVFLPLALLAGEMLITFYFNLYYGFSVAEILPTIISSVAFLVLPKNFLKQLSSLFTASNERLAVKNVVNRNRELLGRRLSCLSEVFCDMNEVFKKLIKSQMSEEEVKDMLYEEVKDTICKGCPEQKHCHRTFCEDTKKIFKELITISFERGKITILDFPSYLSSRCGRVTHLISEINTLTNQYKSYSTLVGNVDTSKRLISDQLSGISSIMKNLADEVDSLVSFDTSRETKIIDELSSNNIICTDAVIYEKDARSTLASLVVREEDTGKLKLPQVVSKVCGGKMAIYDVHPTEKVGLVNVNLKSAPMFDCVFGIASQPKSGSNISGDSHSIERLDGDKFMFAICDGMGSGQEAGEKSQTAVGLVENFYKAGFDNEIILSSVNKLLNLEKDDIFSTIDIVVIDLKNGIADFVKMGSASSYIRGQDECKIIECSSLPIGILQDVNTVTKKVVLNEKDMIVLCSDGINDAFGSDSQFRDFLLTIKSVNPQEVADKILERALANNNGYAVDDMTCLVVKIF